MPLRLNLGTCRCSTVTDQSGSSSSLFLIPKISALHLKKQPRPLKWCVCPSPVGCVCLTSSASVDRWPGRFCATAATLLLRHLGAGMFSTPATHPLGVGSLAPPPPEGPCQPPLSPSWRLAGARGPSLGKSRCGSHTASAVKKVRRQASKSWFFFKMNQHNKSRQQLLFSSTQSSGVNRNSTAALKFNLQTSKIQGRTKKILVISKKQKQSVGWRQFVSLPKLKC